LNDWEEDWRIDQKNRRVRGMIGKRIYRGERNRRQKRKRI
jgi:hypothetical protein